MDLQLKAKKALVTGSTMGIGKAIAQALANESAQVIINGRTKEKVEETLQELQTAHPQTQFSAITADLGTRAGCEQAITELPEIDILVNNLGIFEASDFFTTTDEQWQKMFDVNVMSGVRLTRHYLKRMIEQQWGRIVFIASESAIAPAPEMAHYSATKTMQLSLSRSLSEIAKGTNVTVNTVLPGSTITEGVVDFIKDLFPQDSIEVAEKRFMRENRPTSLLERLIRPEEVAAFVTFICSPLSSAISGAALRVDGGLVRTIV